MFSIPAVTVPSTRKRRVEGCPGRTVVITYYTLYRESLGHSKPSVPKSSCPYPMYIPQPSFFVIVHHQIKVTPLYSIIQSSQFGKCLQSHFPQPLIPIHCQTKSFLPLNYVSSTLFSIPFAFIDHLAFLTSVLEKEPRSKPRA